MSVDQDSVTSTFDGLRKIIQSKYGNNYVEFTNENGIPMILTLDSSDSSDIATYFFISQGKVVYIMFAYDTTKAETISTSIIDSARLLAAEKTAMQKTLHRRSV